MKKTYIIPALQVDDTLPLSNILLSTSDGPNGSPLTSEDIGSGAGKFTIDTKSQDIWDNEW